MGLAARFSALWVLAGAAGAAAGLFLPWWRHESGVERTPWAHTPEVGLVLAVAAVVGLAGLALLVLSHRLPSAVAAVGVIASVALVGLLAYRIVDMPALPLDDPQYSPDTGRTVSMAGAGAALVALAVGVVLARRKRCPDCAEWVSHGSEGCPHCGYAFPPRRGWRRCENCAGTVRADARLCKHCKEPLAS